MRLNDICAKLRSLLKIIYVKISNPRSRVLIRGFSVISSKTDIEVGKNSLLEICRGLHTRKNSILAVRDGAELRIGNGVFINRNTIIIARKSIVIQDGVTIGPNVCIYDHDHDIKNRGKYTSDKIIIMKNTWIGSNVAILKGVTIGENSVIASGSVVTKDVPANSMFIQKRESTIFSI